MIKLTLIELQKIFHKKSIYIIILLMQTFCILNNYLYFRDYDEEGFYKYQTVENLKKEKNTIKKELNKLDINSEKDTSIYLNLTSKLEIISIKEKYPSSSWQYKEAYNILYETIYMKNKYKLLLENKETLTSIEKEYNKLLNNLITNNWKYFIREELTEQQAYLNELKEKRKTIKDNLELKKIKNEINNTKINIDMLNYRINNNVNKNNTYLNKSIEKIIDNKKILNSLNNKFKLNKEEKKQKEESRAEISMNKYILKHKQNINKENTTSYELRTILEDYELFFIILILIVSSITICEEFTKGTIKLLLIKPYSRGKILLSKYLACFLVFTICLMILIVTELLVGSYFFGIENLKLPIIVYNYNKKELMSFSIYTYMIIRILIKLPFFIMIETIAFCLSVFSLSTATSITVPLLIYLFDSTIVNITKEKGIKIIYYFINNHWHFENYLWKMNSELNKSIIIYICYFIIIQTLTFCYFKKKNIKNI